MELMWKVCHVYLLPYFSTFLIVHWTAVDQEYGVYNWSGIGVNITVNPKIWGASIPKNLNVSLFDLQLSLPDSLSNYDVAWAAPTGDAPSTSDWSAIILPTTVRCILEFCRQWYANTLLYSYQYSLHTVYNNSTW